MLLGVELFLQVHTSSHTQTVLDVLHMLYSFLSQTFTCKVNKLVTKKAGNKTRGRKQHCEWWSETRVFIDKT